ncbi:conserved hypothetical protein [Candidatus Nitrosymbiomonas proteolyticus]|uniref:Transmembrane protein n=1 Tax=Candidatus Nitrosymbiomonas proteolyticus TaxID=2608984 RepID=A0A809SE25_9BACT|nr:conserved hypothetical protein [Candidatus Nitrosymbiomonas proteolyticus]
MEGTQSENRKMHWLGWIVLALAFIEGGWLAFDGGRALVVGDYVTPTSGQYAGQLGPWAKVVSAVGIEPRSTLMKSIHLGLGVAWLVVMICFALRLPWAWAGMVACAALGLWYLPFGTLLSIVQVVLLLMPALRGSSS